MSIGTVSDISLFGYDISAAPLDTSVISTIGWLRFDLNRDGSIGAFYFGPTTPVINPAAVSSHYSINTPTVTNVSSPVAPLQAWGIFTIKPPTVHTTSDIVVSFTGKPLVGKEPLTVTYTAKVVLSGNANGAYLVKEYHWYFDYATYPSVYEVSITPIINHTYIGYYGKKFSVRLEVILK